MQSTIETPLQSVEDLILNADEWVRHSVARNKGLPSEVWERTLDLRSMSPDTRLAVIQDLEPEDFHFDDARGLCVALESLARRLLKHPTALTLREEGQRLREIPEVRHEFRSAKGPIAELLRLQAIAAAVRNREPQHVMPDTSAADLRTWGSSKPSSDHKTPAPPAFVVLRDEALAKIARARRPSRHHALVSHATLNHLNVDKRDEQSQRRENWLKRLLQDPFRVLPAARLQQVQRLDALGLSFPNFIPVIDLIRDQIRLQAAGAASASFLPVLMLGPPGIGKTAFAERLARCIDHENLYINTGGVSASWVLKGNSASWNGAGPGMVFKAVVGLGQKRGLLVTLDEVDKALQSGRQFPVEPVLLELLEPGQLRRFGDEFMAIELNLLGLCSFIATANSLDAISAPVRSRFQIVRVKAPSQQQMAAIVRSVDGNLREEHRYLNRLFQPLSAPVIDSLSALTPRELQRFLHRLYSQHVPEKRRERREITALDVARSMATRFG